LGLIDKRERRNPVIFKNNALEYWSKYFNFKKFQIKDKKFSGSFSTDGINVSIYMTRGVRKRPDEKDNVIHLNF